MKKKLLITVGAGASIGFDIPSVCKVDSILDTCASANFPLVSNPKSNLYSHIRDAIDAYYGTAPKSALRKWANFEEVLYMLNLMAPYCSDPNRFHGANALLMPESLPDVLEFGRSPKAVNGDVLRNLSVILLDTLVDNFIDACASAAIQKSVEINTLGSFLAALSDEFDIGIITLNYDNIFTQALPTLFTGFDSATGAFDPLSVLKREDWGFIYHLHGSIHFAMTRTKHDLHRIVWDASPAKNNGNHALGRNTQSSMEGTAYPTSTIVAGYGKTQQILRQPFRTYFAQANRLIQEADSLLFLGYGFGDLHLNSLFSEVRDRRRPAVVIDFANGNQDPLAIRGDAWAYQLSKTLPANKLNASSVKSVSHFWLGKFAKSMI